MGLRFELREEVGTLGSRCAPKSKSTSTYNEKYDRNIAQQCFDPSC